MGTQLHVQISIMYSLKLLKSPESRGSTIIWQYGDICVLSVSKTAAATVPVDLEASI